MSQRKRRLLANLCILVGLFLIAFLGQTTTLICQRTKSGIHCRIEKDFLGFRLKQVIIHQLRKAEVEYRGPTGGTYGGSSPTYRVVLITESGNRVPMTRSYTGGRDDKQEAADRINAFIGNPSDQPPLEIQRTGWRGWLWGGAMLMLGVLLISVKAGIGEKKRSIIVPPAEPEPVAVPDLGVTEEAEESDPQVYEESVSKVRPSIKKYKCLGVMWMIGGVICFALFKPIINSHPPYTSLGFAVIFVGGLFGIFYLSKRTEKREAEERKKLGISGGVENESEEEAEL